MIRVLSGTSLPEPQETGPGVTCGEVQVAGIAPGLARRQARRAATSIEYAFVVSLIAVAVIAGVQHLGLITGGLFSQSSNSISEAQKASQGGSPNPSPP